jgi:hypothetical protein
MEGHMVRMTLVGIGLSMVSAMASAQGLPGPPPPPLIPLQQSIPLPPNGPLPPDQRQVRDRAGAAFTLVDYFDYPEPHTLALESEPMIGVGNDALWECLETRAARVALSKGKTQQAAR